VVQFKIFSAAFVGKSNTCHLLRPNHRLQKGQVVNNQFAWGIESFTRALIIRQYTGFRNAAETNLRFRENVTKGQTGISVAFDLPTQLWLEIDDPLALGQVGEVGVPISHIGDMETLFAELPIERLNTSMTINSPAIWLAALYIAVANRRGLNPNQIRWTVQHDLWKEFTARGTYVLSPETSKRFQIDAFRYVIQHSPDSNPMNGCGYHLGESGATPPMEMAFMFASACSVLDELKKLRDRGEISPGEFERCVGRMGFFVWVGIRMEEQTAKFRAAHIVWERITRERYGVQTLRYRKLRMGSQSASIHLTREQPELNLVRLSYPPVAASYGGLVALALSCADEAYRTPTAMMQQLSIRTQQIAYYETDLRCGEPADPSELFIGSAEDKWAGSHYMEELTSRMQEAIEDYLRQLDSIPIDEDKLRFIKQEMLKANRQRLGLIEQGRVGDGGRPTGLPLIGINAFTEKLPECFFDDLDEKVSNAASEELQLVRELGRWRESRNNAQVKESLQNLQQALESGENSMPFFIACAEAGCTTGEIGTLVRVHFGDYRVPNPLEMYSVDPNALDYETKQAAEHTKSFVDSRGRSVRCIIGSIGLDGHSGAAEQVAVRCREVGMEVIYIGQRHTPSAVANAAVEEDVTFVGISIMSGAVKRLVESMLRALAEQGGEKIPLVVGGIISESEKRELLAIPQVVGVYTPNDHNLSGICVDIVNKLKQYETALSTPM